MEKFTKIITFDGIANSIAKIERKRKEEGEEYFNLYATIGYKNSCDDLYVSLTKDDAVKLVDNIMNRQLTFVGITRGFDKILDDIDLHIQLKL